MIMENQPDGIECQVCHNHFKVAEVIKGGLVGKDIEGLIQADHPDWSPGEYICLADLNLYRTKYVAEVLKNSSQEIYDFEQQMAQSLQAEELLSRNINKEFEKSLTLGERLADRLADFGGSWTFISIFMFILFAWMGVNTWILLEKPFDPYPYIFLNLILSCLAAIQAPVIMMSQNRQEARDRLQSENDYRINIKAEIEIRKLHEKIDHLLMHQWQRLLEIQQLQVGLIEQLSRNSCQPDKISQG
jgi:uncharacterized membrane protein